ncbi:MAG: hypothetical protein Aurels2KO_40230 [Aureliella sp.]
MQINRFISTLPQSSAPSAGSKGTSPQQAAAPVAPRPAIEDRVDFSEEARLRLAGVSSEESQEQSGKSEPEETLPGLPGREDRSAAADRRPSGESSEDSEAAKRVARATQEESEPPKLDSELTPEEIEQIKKLEAKDREVRAHERARLATAGRYAKSGPSYTYAQGPDGKRYAVGGKVKIDTSPVEGDPRATARKAQLVRAAALAPSEPTVQDLRRAIAATQMELQALSQLRQETQDRNLNARQNPFAKSVPLSGTRLNTVA